MSEPITPNAETPTNQPAIPTAQPTAVPQGSSSQPPASPSDPVKMAEELGRLKAENEKLTKFSEQITPVLETIYSDEETLKDLTKKHNIRLGITPADSDPKAPTTPVSGGVSSETKELRQVEMQRITREFEDRAGFTKMTPEQQKDARAAIGIKLKEWLDPNNNKTPQQVFDEVSLSKYGKYLEDSWSLIDGPSRIEQVKKQAQLEYENNLQGMIGGIPSTPIVPDNITLSAEERRVARNMGQTDEQYLESKKKLIASRQS